VKNRGDLYGHIQGLKYKLTGIGSMD